MSKIDFTHRLTVLVFVLMGVIGGIGFTLSYEALMTVAQTHGKPGWLGVLWPLIIDVPIVAFSLAAVIATSSGKPATVPRAVVVLATLATIAYNWFHAAAPVPLPEYVVRVTVATAAPVMYFLSFEVSLWLIGIVSTRRNVGKMTLPATTKPDKQPDILPPVDAPKPAKTAVKPAKVADTKPGKQPDKMTADERRAFILANREMTQIELADATGASVRTVARDIKALNGSYAK